MSENEQESDIGIMQLVLMTEILSLLDRHLNKDIDPVTDVDRSTLLAIIAKARETIGATLKQD